MDAGNSGALERRQPDQRGDLRKSPIGEKTLLTSERMRNYCHMERRCGRWADREMGKEARQAREEA